MSSEHGRSWQARADRLRRLSIEMTTAAGSGRPTPSLSAAAGPSAGRRP